MSTMTLAESPLARRALDLVTDLQEQLVDRLDAVSASQGDGHRLQPAHWLRDHGRHGGGTRYGIGDTQVFNRASVNVSQVHYDDIPDKKLGSATALSTIVHPQHPRAPSMHMHISWTEYKDGRGYWRVMADLNPSMPHDADTAAFTDTLRDAAGDLYDEAAAQGDRYFHIPALDRHRGVSHFYLESYTSGDFDADFALARRVGEEVIRTYGALVEGALERHGAPTDEERAAQLAYHTVYLFQVCTLDRGTTSGLLVHDQNDVGILGSLPARVDRDRLASWADAVPAVQVPLVRALADALPDGVPTDVTVEAKKRLAQAIRSHYRAHPEALDLQARGNVIPPTVANHEK